MKHKIYPQIKFLGMRYGFYCLCFFVFGLGWNTAPLLSKSLTHVLYTKPVETPLPSKMREWRYIVIHHSGSSCGNEDIIQTDHLRRGMENGMAYHFLIGNGSAGLGDGQIVEGHRWKYQLQGGHCHQDYLNEYGIGICFVGNFNRKGPTFEQTKSFFKLVLHLQEEFQIPDDHIHGHGEFYGEDSDCPGRLFPWRDLSPTLNAAYDGSLVSNVMGNHSRSK